MIIATTQIFAQDRHYRLESFIDYADRLCEQGKYQKALDKYYEVLNQITREEDDEFYAQVMYGIGMVHFNLSDEGDKADNLHIAIDAIAQALEIVKSWEQQEDYLSVLTDLTDCYQALAEVENCESNLNTALQLFDEFEAHFQSDLDLKNISQIDYWKAMIYLDLGRIRNSEANVMKSSELMRASYDTMFSLYGEELEPTNYRIVTDVSCAYNYIILASIRDREKNLTQALYLLEKPLEQIASEADPEIYVGVQIAMAEYYNCYSHIEKPVEYLQKALLTASDMQESMSDWMYQSEKMSLKWDIGYDFYCLAKYQDTLQNLQLALNYFDEISEYYRREDFVLYYAGLQNDYASLYLALSEVTDTRTNIDSAFAHLRKIEEMATREDYPILYAYYQVTLGEACLDLADLENASANLNKSIEALKKGIDAARQENYLNLIENASSLLDKAVNKLGKLKTM